MVANNVQFLNRGTRGGEGAGDAIQLPDEPLPEEPVESSSGPKKKSGPIEISKEELSPDEEVPF